MAELEFELLGYSISKALKGFHLQTLRTEMNVEKCISNCFFGFSSCLEQNVWHLAIKSTHLPIQMCSTYKCTSTHTHTYAHFCQKISSKRAERFVFAVSYLSALESSLVHININ